ncbi:phosphoribosylamine--glycine ligase [Lysobacter sp. 13A]|uniref:Phosphoribosylamine--glycine ligase n=1 Tax=Novilysobacter selenitireducens TaxID=2872639 RepID=A0ABS7T9R8_9GAMM|nr:phosphoribosylamine--glycine ligase [Lysobacter selenitireducens]
MSRTYARTLPAPSQPVLGDALFFAAVFVLVAIVFGLVGLLFKSTVFNAIAGLATSYVAARLTARRFARKHGRPLRAERMPLLLWCALLIFVMSLVGVSLMVEAYNNQLFNFRKLSGGFTLAASVAGTLAHLPVLWLAYWIVGRNDGEDDASGPESPRAGASTGAAPRSVALQKVLVIGGGGREHALAWKLAQSRRVAEVLVAPGNAGTATERKCRNVGVSATDIDALVELVRHENVAVTVVGPEAPLVAGVVDRFRREGLRIFGPSAAAAQLEGSKAFAKAFLARHGIPTAHYAVHSDVEQALAYVREKGAPIVIKADGLAAGKGVVVAMTLEEAESAVTDMLSGNAFGEAGSRVVVEEFLTGEEASFISMVDGRTALPMATSQDHKRVGDGDTGPNTGGMGAYSPAPVVTPEVHARVMREVVEPTVRGMAADGIPFTGFLYAGLMIDEAGAPKVIEFNVRFGDPETQPVMLRLQSDLLELVEAAIDGRLDEVESRWNPRPSLGVVMAAHNYPGTPRTGDAIRGLDSTPPLGAKVFHAGTKLDEAGRVVTSGGRVLCVCALGDSVADAQREAYAVVDTIGWDGEFHRSDIGWRAIERERG